jgi:hypothetical protein
VFGVCYGLIPSLSRNPLIEGCVFASLPEKKSRRMEYRRQLFKNIFKSLFKFKQLKGRQAHILHKLAVFTSRTQCEVQA